MADKRSEADGCFTQIAGALLLAAVGVGALWSWNIALGIIGVLVLIFVGFAITQALGG